LDDMNTDDRLASLEARMHANEKGIDRLDRDKNSLLNIINEQEKVFRRIEKELKSLQLITKPKPEWTEKPEPAVQFYTWATSPPATVGWHKFPCASYCQGCLRSWSFEGRKRVSQFEDIPSSLQETFYYSNCSQHTYSGFPVETPA
jgi:uncharacterized coiled-coil protein SlyX